MASSGAFFTEGSYTKNTPGEVDFMMSQLKKYSCESTKPTLKEISRLAALKLPLVATTTPIDIQKFMGKWFVMANIPMSVEVDASNSVENYHWDTARGAIDVLFERGITSGCQVKIRNVREDHECTYQFILGTRP